jgi:hypothetical protein
MTPKGVLDVILTDLIPLGLEISQTTWLGIVHSISTFALAIEGKAITPTVGIKTRRLLKRYLLLLRVI